MQASETEKSLDAPEDIFPMDTQDVSDLITDSRDKEASVFTDLEVSNSTDCT